MNTYRAWDRRKKDANLREDYLIRTALSIGQPVLNGATFSLYLQHETTKARVLYTRFTFNHMKQDSSMGKCKSCGVDTGFMTTYCNECIGQNNKRILEKRNAVAEGKTNQEDFSQLILATTAQSLEGQHVIKTIDIVTAECVFGMNFFRDFFAGVRDIFGGRSEASQKVLRDARVTCLNELRREAAAVGGNAVIAVDLDYSEFSGGGKSMLFLVASGTAVVVEPKDGHHARSEGAVD